MDKIILFVGKSYGLNYFFAGIDSQSLQMMSYCMIQIVFGGVYTVPLLIGMFVGLILVSICLLLGIAYAFMAIRAKKLIYDLNKSPKPPTRAEKAKATFPELIDMTQTKYRHICFVYEPLKYTEEMYKLLYPCVNIIRSVMVSVFLAGFANSNLGQLLPIFFVELVYFVYIAKCFMKKSIFEYIFDCGISLLCIVFIIIKLITLLPMSEIKRQSTFGNIIGWLLLIYFMLVMLFLLIQSAIVLIQLLRLIIAKIRAKKAPAEAQKLPDDSISVESPINMAKGGPPQTIATNNISAVKINKEDNRAKSAKVDGIDLEDSNRKLVNNNNSPVKKTSPFRPEFSQSVIEPRFQLYADNAGREVALPTLSSNPSSQGYQSQRPDPEADLNLPIRPYHFDLSVYKSYVAESRAMHGGGGNSTQKHS